MRVRLLGTIALVSLIAVIAGYVAGVGHGGNRPPNIVLIYNGPSIANTHAAPDTPAFTSWCATQGPCAPSVDLPMYDAATGQLQGRIYVWTKNFAFSADGKSECFGEFVWFKLDGGDLYSHSGGNGTCGGAIDGSLKAPTHISGPGAVIAGGGDGTLVGGTGRFSNWTGTYTDRVFVEIGATNYYDQIFWSINRSWGLKRGRPGAPPLLKGQKPRGSTRTSCCRSRPRV